MEQGNDNNSIVRKLVESSHKELVTKFVLPNMSVMSIFFYLSVFALDKFKLLVMGFGFCITFANVYLTSASRKLRIGPWMMDSRSDRCDAIRWLFNIVVGDVCLVWFLGPGPTGGFAIWLTILISAQADTFSKNHRLLVTSAAIITGALLFWFLYPQIGWREHLSINAGFIGTSVVFWQIERYWVQSMIDAVDAQQRQMQVQVQAESLKRDALIGTQSKTISHELNNLITIMDMNSSSPDPRAIQRAKKTIDLIKRINAIVLDKLSAEAKKRSFTVQEIFDDLDLLTKKFVYSNGIAWKVSVTPEVAATCFEERTGSIFFILQNFAKNSCEAILARRSELATFDQTGCITISADLDGDEVVLNFEDDGIGMSENLRSSILAGGSATTKETGHGIGLRFAIQECEKNNFKLDITSAPGKGSRFTLRIPIATASKIAA